MKQRQRRHARPRCTPKLRFKWGLGFDGVAVQGGTFAEFMRRQIKSLVAELAPLAPILSAPGNASGTYSRPEGLGVDLRGRDEHAVWAPAPYDLPPLDAATKAEIARQVQMGMPPLMTSTDPARVPKPLTLEKFRAAVHSLRFRNLAHFITPSED